MKRKKMGPKKEPKADTLRYFALIKKWSRKKHVLYIGIIVAYIPRNEYSDAPTKKKIGMQWWSQSVNNRQKKAICVLFFVSQKYTPGVFKFLVHVSTEDVKMLIELKSDSFLVECNKTWTKQRKKNTFFH